MTIVGLLISSFATYYVSRVLLFEEKTSHYGPFPSETDKVVWTQGVTASSIKEYVQPVTLFDRIRRLFGMYHVDKHEEGGQTWFVNSKRVEMWTCPVCLSFWVSLPITAVSLLVGVLPLNQLILSPFALSGISTILHKVLAAMDDMGTNVFIESGASDERN